MTKSGNAIEIRRSEAEEYPSEKSQCEESGEENRSEEELKNIGLKTEETSEEEKRN
jgi:hypothetical protein